MVPQALITQGSQIDAKNHKNDTPLIHASGKNHLEIVAALIASGTSEFEFPYTTPQQGSHIFLGSQVLGDHFSHVRDSA